MFNLEAYEVVGCEEERAESDSEGRRVSSVLSALVECRSL